MRVLSGKDPWWSLICFGEKRIETRGWAPWFQVHLLQPPFPIALHISAKMDAADRETCYHDSVFRAALERHGVTFQRRKRDYEGDESYDPIGLLPAGHVVAVATVARVERMTRPAVPPNCWYALTREVYGWDERRERAFGFYARDRWAWLLTDVRLLATPIPAKGHLGLWAWEPPAGALL